MLRSHGLQSSLFPVMSFYCPVRRRRPEIEPVFYQHRNLQQVLSSLDLMDKLRNSLLEEMEPFQTSTEVKPVFQQLEKEGPHFGLTLDTRGFSPEELSVRQVGRQLRVSGRSEQKQGEEEKGSYSYRLQEFRREFDLPEGADPKDVTCFLDPDGKLHIQAAGAPPVQEAERELVIKSSSEENTQKSVCSERDGGSTETHNSSQNTP
ncbi:heat shock protein 30-like [Antennarius striatus]|uniref:heat shock protein 30-like n=1 Tax=Antennarius striatus TaxID=241820 RepID=UPI0035AE4BDF